MKGAGGEGREDTRASLQVPGRPEPRGSTGRDEVAIRVLAAARRDGRAWLQETVLGSLDEPAVDWLCEALAAADDPRAMDIAFGLAPRRVGRTRLDLGCSDSDRPRMPGWRPEGLPTDTAARMLLALAHSDHDIDAVVRLLRHAEMGEEVALYAALWLYPAATRLSEPVGRGLRTHARPVFEAIAHCNPWPAAHLDEHRWNHLVLKALFVGAALAPIHGLDARANPTLGRMLLDFADERRAAGREVPHELWRCALPFAPADRLAGHALPSSTDRY